MTETFFVANQVDRGHDWHHVNNDRAGQADPANRQGCQDRDMTNLPPCERTLGDKQRLELREHLAPRRWSTYASYCTPSWREQPNHL